MGQAGPRLFQLPGAGAGRILGEWHLICTRIGRGVKADGPSGIFEGGERWGSFNWRGCGDCTVVSSSPRAHLRMTEHYIKGYWTPWSPYVVSGVILFPRDIYMKYLRSSTTCAKADSSIVSDTTTQLTLRATPAIAPVPYPSFPSSEPRQTRQAERKRPWHPPSQNLRRRRCWT